MSAKKLINNPEKVVDEALEALIRTNPGVQGIENHRVVGRSDLNNLQDKVAIICGGGSGHEPAFAGYVGQGCLSGAIAGSVFASPPPSSILAAILSIASKKPSGILVVCTFIYVNTLLHGLLVSKWMLCFIFRLSIITLEIGLTLVWLWREPEL